MTDIQSKKSDNTKKPTETRNEPISIYSQQRPAIPRELQAFMEYCETDLEKCTKVSSIALDLGVKEKQLEWFETRYKGINVRKDKEGIERIVNYVPIVHS
jgi:AAA15 family ATPase/GTPase